MEAYKGVQTTTIGAWPKGPNNPYEDWFSNPNMSILNAQAAWKAVQAMDPKQLEELLEAETERIMRAQKVVGIDIPTDGEVRRISYVHYPCQHVDGIDMDDMVSVTARDGRWHGYVPTIKEKILAQSKYYLPHDFEVAQKFTDKQVKITTAGPMTIADSLADKFYGSDDDLDGPEKYWELVIDIAIALNSELRALADAGCPYIQIDEPVFARYPGRANYRGFEALEICLQGISSQTTHVLHVCGGYPLALDDASYEKADKNAYRILAPSIEKSSFQQVSLEHAHEPMDLSVLKMFKNTKVILGVVAVAKSDLESVADIRKELQKARRYINSERLIAAPDCGLGFLSDDLTMLKLRNLVEAAHSIR